MNWYDALYADDPATDNIFGREALAERRTPLLHEYLRLGGTLSGFVRSDFARPAARNHAPQQESSP